MKLILAGLVVVCSSTGLQLSRGVDLPVSTADDSTPKEWASEIINVKYAKASDITAALNNLTTSYQGLGTNPLAFNREAADILSNLWTNLSPDFKKLNSAREAHEIRNLGQDRIIADERTNSLLIYASRRDLKLLKEAISRLDVPREKILIEAVLFEVTLTGSNSIEMPYFGASDEFTSKGKAGSDLDLVVTQLATNKHVKILQRPRIQTADGVSASLFVGDSRYCSRFQSEAPKADSARHSLNEVVGLTLDVTATISPDRKLVMNIAQTIEKIAGSTNIVNVGDVPITNRQKCQAELTMADRETILLGGSIEEAQDKPSRGVPILKSTPLIGGLFRNHPHAIRRESVLAIRATILPQKVAPNPSALARKEVAFLSQAFLLR